MSNPAGFHPGHSARRRQASRPAIGYGNIRFSPWRCRRLNRRDLLRSRQEPTSTDVEQSSHCLREINLAIWLAQESARCIGLAVPSRELGVTRREKDPCIWSEGAEPPSEIISSHP